MKAINFLRYVIMCVFILIGLQYSKAQENDIMQGSPERDYCYGGDVYSGYGTISGAGKVYMVIEIVGDYISGKYYYVKTNKNRKNIAWIYLDGTWGYDGTINLAEEGYSNKNGTFVGRFVKSGAFKGTFYRNDGKRFSFNINLK